MAVELAIQPRALADGNDAAAVPSVDAARLKNVGQFYRATGLFPEQADAQAFLFIALSSAKVCCFSSAVRASARSSLRSPPRSSLNTRLEARPAESRPQSHGAAYAAPFSFLVHSL
jgi:hypothetical protein